MSATDGVWVVYGRCPHGFKAELTFNEMGYVMKPHPDECKSHERAAANLPQPPPPGLGLSERQMRREAKRAAKRAEREGWRPPWL